MVLPTGIEGIRIFLMIRPRLEVVDMCNLVTRGLVKRTPNLTTQSYKVKDPQLPQGGEKTHAFTVLTFK